MRYAKAIGLALIAALALSAFGASAAQAEKPADFWAAEGAVKIDATSESDQIFTLTGKSSLTCKHAQGDAQYIEETPTLTGENVEYTDTKFTKDEVEYCHVVAFGVTLPVTVKEHGCHFKFEAGTYDASASEGTGGSTGSVEITGCEEANPSITIEIWNAKHTEVVCEFHIPEQTIGNINYYNKLTEGVHAVTIEAANAPVKTTVTEKPSALCPEHETVNADYDGSLWAKATDEGEEYVDHTVTGTP